MTLARRLDALTKCYPSRPACRPPLDFSALTFDERYELDAILATLDGVPKRPNGRPNLSPLTDAELERLNEITERITFKEPE